MQRSGYKLFVLTNPNFARWGGYIGNINAEKLLSKWFPRSKHQIEIVPWSINDLIRCASISDFAIIPVDTSDKFASLKPENKLLSMWHLGLPTLFSNTFAYKRLADEVGVSQYCIDDASWHSILCEIKNDQFDDLITKTDSYINKTHTKEILVNKWQKVFDSVLAKNV